MTGYTVAWIFWIAMFLLIEGKALIDKDRGDTLSEHVWKWFRVRGRTKTWVARRYALAAFLVWLTLHLTTGWF